MRLSAALLVVLLVVSSVAGAGAGRPADDRAPTSGVVSVGPPTDATAAIDGSPANETPPNATVRDGTEMFVSLRENGNARWNVSFRFVLRDRNETEAFQRLAERYRNGNTDVGHSLETFERVVEHANSDVDREMDVRRVNRSTGLRKNGSVGVVSLSFTWTNFTRVEGSRIVLGDVFWVDSKTWLPTLNDDQTLVIAGPEKYYISGASPSGGTISSGTVLRYEGPQRFESGDFSVTYSPKVTETSETPTTTPKSDFPLSGTSGLLIVLLLFGGGFGAYALAQRRGPDADGVGGSDGGGVTPLSHSSDEGVPEDRDGEADRDGHEDEDGEDDEDDEPAPELLSDEERVLRLLRKNDGRMKQAQIVQKTNWSNAKVSQLLSKMDDNGDVNKLRIGRENLITLPDENVTDVD